MPDHPTLPPDVAAAQQREQREAMLREYRKIMRPLYDAVMTDEQAAAHKALLDRYRVDISLLELNSAKAQLAQMEADDAHDKYQRIAQAVNTQDRTYPAIRDLVDRVRDDAEFAFIQRMANLAGVDWQLMVHVVSAIQGGPVPSRMRGDVFGLLERAAAHIQSLPEDHPRNMPDYEEQAS